MTATLTTEPAAKRPLRVLSDSDVAFFEENGYIVVPDVVTPAQRSAVIDAIWEFLGMEPNDSSTWYPRDRRGALAYIHQHQALWDTRQSERLYGAFADLHGTDALWVSMDRAGMKPPIDDRYPEHDDRGFVHWDLDTAQPLPSVLGLQGVLALTDTTEEMGGFCCIPGFHRDLDKWIAEQPADRNPRHPDLSRLPDGRRVTPIPMKAGDIVIWNRLLAHGNGRNEGTQPRLAQYITMFPAAPHGEEARQERIGCWQERLPPKGWEKDVPEKFRGRERANPAANLSPLGRKLLGLDLW